MYLAQEYLLGHYLTVISTWFSELRPFVVFRGAAVCSAKSVPSFPSCFKTLSVGPPGESNSRPPALAVKRSAHDPF